MLLRIAQGDQGAAYAPSGMTLTMSRRSGRVEDLPWIEDVVGVKCPLDRSVHLHHRGRQLLAQAVPLEQADAVFAGDRAAKRDGIGDDLLEGELGPVPLVVVASLGDQ